MDLNFISAQLHLAQKQINILKMLYEKQGKWKASSKSHRE